MSSQPSNKMSPKLKPITGTWFEFTHHNVPEGKYWNAACRGFSNGDWREKVREIKSLGMKYIVLLCTSLVYEDRAEAYFKTPIYPFAEDFAATDPIGALMDEAEKQGVMVFVSCGYYGPWTQTFNNMTSAEVKKRAFAAMEEVYLLYGRHKYKSFYGWYLPDETCVDGSYHPEFINYANRYAGFGRGFDKNLKMLIAPYGTNKLKTNDFFISQLESLDVDFIAYQDEVGVRKSTPEETPAYFEALRVAHDKAGRAALWADMEVFDFEGQVYRSALIPAPIGRIARQIAAISPYADEILCYQYQGMMNKPGTPAFCGHEGSYALYSEYRELISKF